MGFGSPACVRIDLAVVRGDLRSRLDAGVPVGAGSLSSSIRGNRKLFRNADSRRAGLERWAERRDKTYHALQDADLELGESLAGLVTVSDILESLGCVLATNVKEDLLATTVFSIPSAAARSKEGESTANASTPTESHVRGSPMRGNTTLKGVWVLFRWFVLLAPAGRLSRESFGRRDSGAELTGAHRRTWSCRRPCRG